MSNIKRILLIGSDGQVGWELLRCIQPLGKVIPASRNPSKLLQNQIIDLADPDSIRHVIREVKPAIIINAAAYTAVDKAEEESELAYKVNSTAPGILAEECQRLKALLIHYSTDYVFDGNQTEPYTEFDTVNPLGVYGASKLAGEQAIISQGGQYLILRTAWVYGLRGKNFLLTIQHLASTRSELKIIDDQIGAPTWSKMIAQATAHIMAQLYSPRYQLDIEELSGIYHLTCAGQTSWYEFAKAIITESEKQPRVLPITSADYPTSASRPAHSVLSNKKLMNTFSVILPVWNKALKLCLNDRLFLL